MALSDLEEMLGLMDDKEEKEGEGNADGSGDEAGDSGDSASPAEGSEFGGDAGSESSREEGEGSGESERAESGEEAGGEGDDAEGNEDEASEGEGDDAEGLKRQNAGLRKELSKLREQFKLSRVAPIPPEARQTTQQQNTQQPLARVPVLLSDDGKQVYVDPAALDRLIEARATEAAARAVTPTPEQIENNELRLATERFVSESPGNVEVVRRVQEIDEFLTHHVALLVNEGYRITNIHDAVAALESKGVAQQVIAAYPEVGGVGFGDFFALMSTRQPAARRILLRQLAERAPGAPKPKKRLANGAKRPLGEQARPLVRKGGGKQTAATSDEKEFAALEAEFRESGMSLKDFPDSKYKRMNQLGRKLGHEGFDS